MAERHTMRSIFKAAAEAVYKASMETKQATYYETRFKHNSIKVDDYKEQLLYDLIVGRTDEELKAIAEGVYHARGDIPEHLLFHDYFRHFKETHKPFTQTKYNAINLAGRPGFKSYCSTIPVISYQSIYKKAAGFTNNAEYSFLSFVIWADRYVPFYDQNGYLTSKPYVNSNDYILASMGDEFRNVRITNRIREKNPRWYNQLVKEKKINDRGIYEYHDGSSLENIAWIGALVYKPNVRDQKELSDLLVRLIKTSPSGYTTDVGILAYADPLFDQFYSTLKQAGGGLFRFDMIARRYAQKDSPEKFKQLANDLSELSTLANQLSEQFQKFKEEKIIGEATSTASLAGKLLASEIAGNPLKFFNEMEFRPPRWYRQDSLIFWICQEMIQGE